MDEPVSKSTPAEGSVSARLTEGSLRSALPSLPPFLALTDGRKRALFGDPLEGVVLAENERTFIPGKAWMSKLVKQPVPTWFSRLGHVAVHIRAAVPLASLLTAWESAGAHVRVQSFSGTVAFRRTRGGPSLSSHAYGIAFDINAPQNAFGRPPAYPWEDGCVFDLVKIANEHGWFWGGHFKGNPDGMHFELAQP